LPNGLIGQHIINQQGGAFCNSPGTAARTKTSTFTSERNQVFMMKIFTTYSQKTIFQTTADRSFETIGYQKYTHPAYVITVKLFGNLISVILIIKWSKDAAKICLEIL
jgi:hypothetical protein